MSENVGLLVFMLFWSILDAMFSFVDDSFRKIFNAIPGAAIPFLIAIFCYSIVAILVYIINRQKSDNRRLGLKALYWIFVAFVLLFAIWRFGVVMMLEDKLTYETLSEFFVNVVYVLFGMCLVIMFYRNVPWLKKAILLLIWSLFLLLTFVICPALEESELTDSTVYQVFLITFLFVVPNGLNQFKKAKEEGVEK